MTRVAAIDIGTNSVLLLVAEDRGGDLVAVVERARITRLGRGVDAARALDPDAVDETLRCLADYAAEIARLGVARIDVVGTSAMRDARGGEGFIGRAAALLGVAPRVVSGDEEARLTFEGALEGLGLDGPVTVFDLGGGSTEIIRGVSRDRARGSHVERAVSLDVGSVRLTERHLRSDPPRPEEIAAVRADARAALLGAREGFEAQGAFTLVGVAGTVTTLAAFVRGVAPYDPARVHGARLSAAELARATTELAAMPLAARRALPTIDPKRADVIVAGAVVVEEILAWAASRLRLAPDASRPQLAPDASRPQLAPDASRPQLAPDASRLRLAPSELVVSDRGVRWGLARRLASAS